MNVSLKRTVVILLVTLACGIAKGEDEHPVSHLLANIAGEAWATLTAHQGGYQLRLMTAGEKKQADETIEQYTKLRNQRSGASKDDVARITKKFRSLASDVKSADFYRVKRYQGNSIELSRDDLRAILPASSIRMIMIGPTGAFSNDGLSGRTASSGASVSSTSMLQALRGGGGLLAGRVGPTARSARNNDDAAVDLSTKLFYLKHANAVELLDIVQGLHDDRSGELRLAVDERTNAIIVRAAPRTHDEIGELIEALDIVISGPPETTAEPAMLKTYSIKDADPQMVLEVLQTLLTGKPNVRLAIDKSTKKIIISATATEHALVTTTIAELD